jgi:hypothetical protein
VTADTPLPGLEDDGRPTGVTELELAARRSLSALAAAGVLDESHALPMALIMDLARAVAIGTRTGHASAAAMAAAQLREAYAMLPALPDAPTDDDPWSVLVAELRAAGLPPVPASILP